MLEVVPEKAGLASGVVSSTLQIGSAVGTAAISGAFFGAFFGAIGGRSPPDAYAHGFQYSLAVNAPLRFACIGLSVLLVRHQQSASRRVAAPL